MCDKITYLFPNFNGRSRWSLGTDKQFHRTLYNGYNYLWILGLKLVQQHDCLCPESLCLHVISRHVIIGYIYDGSLSSMNSFATTCSTPVLRNGRKCKSVCLFPETILTQRLHYILMALNPETRILQRFLWSTVIDSWMIYFPYGES